jgi:hypothetical protein
MRDETPEVIWGTTSGPAARVAYGFTTRYARTYTSLVTLAYVLGFVPSFLIPHPFPPTRLFMAIVSGVIARARMDPADATGLGFATFVSATKECHMASGFLTDCGSAPLSRCSLV